MALKEYVGYSRLFVRLYNRQAAWKLIEHLTNEAIPFEFMPLPNDMYDVLVKEEYGSMLANALHRLDIEFATTGKQQEVVLETTKVYQYEGVDLRRV